MPESPNQERGADAHLNPRSLLKWAGRLLSLAAVAYVLWEISKTPPNVWHRLLSPGGLGVLLGMSAVYGLSLFCVLVSWRRLLTQTGRDKLDLAECASVYATFQIQKYLPGNVMHQVSRYAFLRQAGISHKVVLWSSVSEVLLLLAAGFTVASITLGPVVLHKLVSVGPETAMIIAACLVLAIIALAAVIWATRRNSYVAQLTGLARSELPSILLALLLLVVFFLVTGVILFMLAQFIHRGGNQLGLSDIIGLNSLSWLAGFLTPGAPGGIGIREVVLVEGASIEDHSSGMVATAAAYRLVSTLGDVAFFLSAKQMSKLLRN